MKTFLYIFFTFLSFILLGQDKVNYERNYNDTLPERLKVNLPSLREHIYQGITEEYKEEKYERTTYEFSDQVSHRISDLLTNGDVYSDWTEFEDYLNEILQKVMPPEMKNDTFIHAYIFKDGALNAFMTPSGQFFMNIGMITEFSDEASLASVFAHELAHYYKRHSLKRHMKSESGKLGGGIFGNRKKSNKFSVANEIEADSLSMEWLKKSNYNLSGALKSFKVMQNIHQRLISRIENKWELEETTHPLSDRRLENYTKFYKKNKDNAGELFLVSQEKFLKFKSKAKIESLKFLMNNFQFSNCLEKSFKFHLMDPDNKMYVYYIMESIRKMCYLDIELWKKNFITNRYFDTLRVNGVRKKEKVDRGLFDKLDFALLPVHQEEARLIKAKFYWEGAPKFKTYNEAFVFYSKVARAMECDECLLSEALSITRNKKQRNKILDDYLKKEGIKYRKFAENLKKDIVNKSLKNKKLLVFNDFNVIVKQGKNAIVVRPINNDSSSTIKYIFDSIAKKNIDRELVFLPDLKKHSLREYKLLNELESLSFLRLRSKGNRTKLHILDPKYIELFYKYDVNEIEFLNCLYSESRKIDKSLEFYKKTINTSYHHFFHKTKSTKFLEVYITSLREVDSKKMKFRYYGNDNSIKFKDPSYHHIISLLNGKLKKKEEKGYDADVEYQDSIETGW